MHLKFIMRVIAGFLFFLSLTNYANAQIAIGGNYTMTQTAAAAGGTSGNAASTGGTYLIEGTIGQSAAGMNQQNAAYKFQPGFWTAQTYAPTAATVSISGRVLTADGKGLTNARVMITDSKGTTWSVLITAFGNFRFDGLSAGETVIVTISSKRYTFAPQVVALTDSITGLTFTAQ